MRPFDLKKNHLNYQPFFLKKKDFSPLYITVFKFMITNKKHYCSSLRVVLPAWWQHSEKQNLCGQHSETETEQSVVRICRNLISLKYFSTFRIFKYFIILSRRSDRTLRRSNIPITQYYILCFSISPSVNIILKT